MIFPRRVSHRLFLNRLGLTQNPNVAGFKFCMQEKRIFQMQIQTLRQKMAWNPKSHDCGVPKDKPVAQ